MPDLPIRELVLQNIEESLLAIAGGEEYFNDRVAVSRVLLPLDAVQSSPMLFVYSPGDVVSARIGSATGISENTMDVIVSAVFERALASDTAANQLAHDIEKAMLQDRERGGYAINTVLIGRNIVANEATEPWATLEVRFQVVYRHSFADPSLQV